MTVAVGVTQGPARVSVTCEGLQTCRKGGFSEPSEEGVASFRQRVFGAYGVTEATQRRLPLLESGAPEHLTPLERATGHSIRGKNITSANSRRGGRAEDSSCGEQSASVHVE